MTHSPTAEEKPGHRTVTVPIGLSHFLDMHKFRLALERCDNELPGPVFVEATGVYLDAMHGEELDDWKEALGPVLWQAIAADLSSEFRRIFMSFEDSLEIRQTTLVAPTIVMAVAQSLLTACRLNQPEVYDIVHMAYHELVDGADNDGVTLMLQPFHDNFKALDGSEMEDSDTRMSGEMARLARQQERMIRHTLAKLSVPLEEIKLAMATVAQPHGPSAVTLPTPADNQQVSQLDGSLAPNVAKELAALFVPERPSYPSSTAQWADTLASLPDPYREPLCLWRKLMEAPVESVRAAEAWAMHAVGRLLMRLYTPEQMTRLCVRVPMEQVVAAVLNFVMEYQTNPPNMSWAQLRVSFTTSPMAMVSTPDTLIAVASSIYEELGLQEEINLLTATIAMHQATLERAITPFKAVGPTH